jgi:nitroreductase
MSLASTETELARIIKERRSVHQFDSREVEPDLVRELLDTAVWAPNHRLTQPWRFVLVHGAGRERLANIARGNIEKRESDNSEARGDGTEVLRPVHERSRFSGRRAEGKSEYGGAGRRFRRHELYPKFQPAGVGARARTRLGKLSWESYPLLGQSEFRETLGIVAGERAIASLHIGYPAKVPPAQPRIPAAELLTVINQP